MDCGRLLPLWVPQPAAAGCGAIGRSAATGFAAAGCDGEQRQQAAAVHGADGTVMLTAAAVQRAGATIISDFMVGLMIRLLLLFSLVLYPFASRAAESVSRLLYVACPGVRDYLDHGGHGVLVFDIDQNYKFVRRIPSAGLNDKGAPMNVKGVCASQSLARLYVSTLKTLMCFDLLTDKILWEKPYAGGCDRMAITPDGKMIYLPSLEAAHWHVVDAATGDVKNVIRPDSGAHNTVASRDGREVYLAGLRSPHLTIADTATHSAARTCGPFTAPIRPFTVNKDSTRCYVCLNELLGFETGDLKSGKKLNRIEVQGFKKGPVKRHGCPSHGIGLTPDGREIWLCDATNQSLHLFDNTKEPAVQTGTIKLRDEPGWITFTLDGKHALPSTGEVIDVKTCKIVLQLTDEEKRAVMSEKMVEIHFKDGKPVAAGDQFGVGR